MGVHLQKAEAHGALVLEEQVSRTCNDPPPTKPILSYRFSSGYRQTHIWLEAALSLTQIIPKEGKDDYIKSASTKKSLSEAMLSCKKEPKGPM